MISCVAYFMLPWESITSCVYCVRWYVSKHVSKSEFKKNKVVVWLLSRYNINPLVCCISWSRMHAKKRLIMSRNSCMCLVEYHLIRMRLSLVHTRLVLHACEPELGELGWFMPCLNISKSCISSWVWVVVFKGYYGNKFGSMYMRVCWCLGVYRSKLVFKRVL